MPVVTLGSDVKFEPVALLESFFDHQSAVEIWNALRQHPSVCWVFDGFEDLANSETLMDVDWVDFMVVTARPTSKRIRHGLVMADLLPFGDDEIHEMIQTRCSEGIAENLVALCAADVAQQELMQTPLMCELVCYLHEHGDDVLSGSRAKLIHSLVGSVSARSLTRRELSDEDRCPIDPACLDILRVCFPKL